MRFVIAAVAVPVKFVGVSVIDFGFRSATWWLPLCVLTDNIDRSRGGS